MTVFIESHTQYLDCQSQLKSRRQNDRYQFLTFRIGNWQLAIKMRKYCLPVNQKKQVINIATEPIINLNGAAPNDYANIPGNFARVILLCGELYSSGSASGTSVPGRSGRGLIDGGMHKWIVQPIKSYPKIHPTPRLL